MNAMMISQFRDRTVAVMGLGRSGLAAVRLLRDSGAKVLAWDDDPDICASLGDDHQFLTPLSEWDFTSIDALILAPGIPFDFPAPHPIVKRARAAHCPILGDVDLLNMANTGASMIGITGSDGKSTTTALLAHLLQDAGKVACAGGNIGIPASALPVLEQGQFYVLEMSSFQLALCRPVSFKVAILLNIGTDHIDRHGSVDGLVAAKERIFHKADAIVIGLDDPHCRRLYATWKKKGARVIGVSSSGPTPGGVSDGVSGDVSDGVSGRVAGDVSGGVSGDVAGIYGDGVDLVDATGDRPEVIATLSSLPMRGAHNAQNYAAVCACARLIGISLPTIRAALASFPGLVHRQQHVGTAKGVTFINDSKATNFSAVRQALLCHQRIFWIAGGKLKNDDFSLLDGALERVQEGFFIGTSARLFMDIFAPHFPCHCCGDVDTAVAAAAARAQNESRAGAQTTVLLSPGGTSLDQWASFEERGDAFIRAAQRWIGRSETVV